jgi:hypothetical protein
MKNLVAVATWVLARAFDTGDDLDETNFDEVLQRAADRAEYLKTQVDDLQAGAKKFRIVASSAALKALTGMGNGEIAVVNATGARGVYFFILTGALPASDLTKWYYRADNLTGYWINLNSELMELGGADGVSPRLSTSAMRAPNSIINYIDFSEVGAALDTSSSGAWQNSGFVTSPFSVQQGDVVDITAHFSVSIETATDEFEMRLAASDNGGTPAAILHTNLDVFPKLADNKVPVCLRGRFAAQSSNNHTVLVQVNGPGGGPVVMTIHPNRSFHGLIIRP